jgi:hypothetical protein
MRYGKTDISLVQVDFKQDKIQMILLGQEDKRSGTAVPVPQIIAEAISAFQYNNRVRSMKGLPFHHHEVSYLVIMCITDMLTTAQDIPAITLVGSLPVENMCCRRLSCCTRPQTTASSYPTLHTGPTAQCRCLLCCHLWVKLTQLTDGYHSTSSPISTTHTSQTWGQYILRQMWDYNGHYA